MDSEQQFPLRFAISGEKTLLVNIDKKYIYIKILHRKFGFVQIRVYLCTNF